MKHAFKNSFMIILTLMSLTFSAVTFTPARAASIIIVNSNADTLADDGTCTLREAITNANADSQLYATAGECVVGAGTDTITFAADYTITLAGSQLPVVTTTITIDGNGVANTILQANANPNSATSRVLQVSSTGDLTINSITVRNGRCNAACPADPSLGGGIHNFGMLTVTNSTLSANSADVFGGGIYNNGGTLTVTNSTFSANSASQGGGGIFNINGSTVLVTNSTFSANSAYGGGGISNVNSATLIVTNSMFFNNSATNFGGGINNDGALTVTNSTFSANSATNFGGGINNDGALTVTNSTFSANSATNIGGGIVNGGTLTVTNSTFSANSATASGSGILTTFGTTTLYNTIMANSLSGINCVQLSGTIINADSANLDTDGSCNNATQMTSAQINLQSLTNNGGPTLTMALGAGSVAIDMGDDANCSSTDQRGVTRPQGSHCDIGAYEEVDNIAPSVMSITRANANPTNAASVSFTVVFSESVTGVDVSDFALTTVGVTGASITTVSGSGTTYTVTVDTGAGSGTLRLDVVDDDSIKDGSNNPLGGVGTGNGNYTAGQMYMVYSIDTTGVFRPSNGLLYLKNATATGYADVAINYGLAGDYPVVGDWDGDGDATIGIYRNGSFYLRNANTLGFADLVFAFGQPGDQPVAGDWNGDGTDTIGIYRPSTGQFLLRNNNSAGAADYTADYSFYLGNVGDVGIAGDWDGDGKDTTGVFRPSNGVIFLKNTNATGFADIALNYGLAGDMPVTGDWDGDGDDTIGVYRNGQFLLRNSNTIGFAEIVFGLGNPGDIPIAGDWNGLP